MAVPHIMSSWDAATTGSSWIQDIQALRSIKLTARSSKGAAPEPDAINGNIMEQNLDAELFLGKSLN